MSPTERRIDILDYLQGLGTKNVYYCPNPGNAGDSAIALGTYRLLDRAELSYEVVRWDEKFDSEGRTLVYGGGGNLAASYPQARTFVERHHRDAERLIVLPHTVQGNGALLQQLGSNVDIFCRERVSLEWVTRRAPDANVYLSDDLAFHLNGTEILARTPVSSGTLARWIVSRPIRGMARRFVPWVGDDEPTALRPALAQGARAFRRLMQSGATTHLYAIRTDRERDGADPPPGNIDVSQVFAYGVAPRAMLEFLNRFDGITTNRLHVCVLALLLDKEIDFYANSYFKNEAVYKFSIKDRYPNVKWCGRWQGR